MIGSCSQSRGLKNPEVLSGTGPLLGSARKRQRGNMGPKRVILIPVLSGIPILNGLLLVSYNHYTQVGNYTNMLYICVDWTQGELLSRHILLIYWVVYVVDFLSQILKLSWTRGCSQSPLIFISSITVMQGTLIRQSEIFSLGYETALANLNKGLTFNLCKISSSMIESNYEV